MLFGEEKEGLHADNPLDFKEIYYSNIQLLFRISYRIVCDEEAAEDLVHDSLIKMSEKKMFFQTMDDAKYWLIRVVKNNSLNYAKRKVRERNAYQKALYEDKRRQTTGEEDYLRKETQLQTVEALNKLPEKLKSILILREYAELNYKEIARVLGITEGNVKIRIFRAREQLAKILGEDNVYLS